MKSLTVILFSVIIVCSCKTSKQALANSTTDNGLIKDCPEELISNQMPSLGKSNKATQYYIYKGERKEVKDFDSTWVNKHCKVKVTVVH